MENSGSILALIGASLLTAYLAVRIHRERERLRRVTAVLGEPDNAFIDSLEALVLNRQLLPTTN